ncbi:hypothetical protein [Aquisalibacillus elongatus]|uniref:Uncharacterized protein n=1 Tax=Aquisalibacillus elongatus TaxID=485577 RepID=A0A3N5C8B1_9BACI|nr:hypothetical protein [Aquisalibacillus elongatus]RPF55762.1 hypothetical protein EDC24_0646 [Aquisalibacillus elongatus]
MKLKLVFIIFITLILSACLYPEERKMENTPTNDEQLEEVQQAVLEYRERHTGLLPIKNSDENTPFYIKYAIDFKTLQDENILGQPPSNSYENGGQYSYVIIDPEDDTEVKVSDVRVNQDLRSINYEINLYRNKAIVPPYGKKINQDYFEINLDKMNIDEPFTVVSPYSNRELEVIIDHEGQPLVDYRPDVYQMLEEEDISQYEGDLRELLVEQHPIVPTYSPPMVLEDGEIQFKEYEKETNE